MDTLKKQLLLEKNRNAILATDYTVKTAEQLISKIDKAADRAPQGDYMATITHGLKCEGEIIANTYGCLELTQYFAETSPKNIKIILGMIEYLADVLQNSDAIVDGECKRVSAYTWKEMAYKNTLEKKSK